MDPEVLLQLCLGWETVARTEGHARELAFTADQAALFVCSEMVALDGPDAPAHGPVPVETAAELAKASHAIVDTMLQQWEG